MDSVLVYLDDILCVSDGTFEEHLKIVTEVIDRLRKKGMQINAKKCGWFRKEIEYLGYLVNQNGIQPMREKVEKILALKAPTTAKQVRGFLGLVNYYRYMWGQRSTLIAPLTECDHRRRKSRKF